MRRTPARLLVAAALCTGLALLAPIGAADSTDAEFNAIVDQDVAIITNAAAAIDKAEPDKKKLVTKNAGTGIKSSALILAGVANARITGNDKAADGHAAAVRDEAIKIFKSASDKDFKGAAAAAKSLADVKPAADPKAIDLAAAFGELTSKEVMDNFKTKDKYGTNVEADIKANAKKATAKPAETALMVQRVLAMGEYNKTVTKAENAGDKKEWDDYNAKMLKVAGELAATTKKKTSPADMAKLFTSLDSSCTACHDKFK